MKLINIFEDTPTANVYPKAEKLFKEVVLNRIDIDYPVADNEEYPWQIFWFDSNGYYVCEWDTVNQEFLFNHQIWDIFDSVAYLGYSEIQEFMGSMLEKYFNLTGVTPHICTYPVMRLVEKHFKRK